MPVLRAAVSVVPDLAGRTCSGDVVDGVLLAYWLGSLAVVGLVWLVGRRRPPWPPAPPAPYWRSPAQFVAAAAGKVACVVGATLIVATGIWAWATPPPKTKIPVVPGYNRSSIRANYPRWCADYHLDWCDATPAPPVRPTASATPTLPTAGQGPVGPGVYQP